MPASLDRRELVKILSGTLAALPVSNMLAGCSNNATAGSNSAELAGTGTWEEGTRFPSSTSADEVADWAVSLSQ